MQGDSSELIRSFVAGFTKLHLQDVQVARAALISAFIAPYSMMDTQQRLYTISSLLTLVREISGEKFEDGTDFISFLREKQEERKISEERA